MFSRFESFAPGFEMNQLHHEMNRLFKRSTATPSVYPHLNVWENDTTITVEAELPGIEIESLDIHMTPDHQLTIQGQRNRPEQDGAQWIRRETNSGTFTRVVQLPTQVDAGGIDAQLINGILTVHLPKAECAKLKKISVRTSE